MVVGFTIFGQLSHQGIPVDSKRKELQTILSERSAYNVIIIDWNWKDYKRSENVRAFIWDQSQFAWVTYLGQIYQYLSFLQKHYGWTNGPTDRRTQPLIEMRGCI